MIECFQIVSSLGKVKYISPSGRYVLLSSRVCDTSFPQRLGIVTCIAVKKEIKDGRSTEEFRGSPPGARTNQTTRDILGHREF